MGIGLTLGGAAVSAGGAYAYFWDQSRSDVIADGITVDGVAVGGLRSAQARALLERRLVPRLARPVSVVAAGHRFTLDPAAAGLRVELSSMVASAVQASRSGGLARRLLRDVRGRPLDDAVPLRAGLADGSLARFVDSVAFVLDQRAADARLVPTPVRLRIVRSHAGLAVRRPQLRSELFAAILHAGAARTLRVPMRSVAPRVRTSTLAHRYGTFILVSRETFTLRLYKRLRLARTYPIAVGRAGLETPAGLYSIYDKQVNPSWHVPLSSWAGSLAGQVIPPGPADPIKARWLGFYSGAGIHGTDEISSIGSAASHGCIRMRIPDVEQLYDLVPLHTPIFVG